MPRRRARFFRRAALVALAASGALLPRTARGEPPPPGVPQAGATGAVHEVRVALSTSAAARIGEARIRQLVEIELDDPLVLAPGLGGPLDASVIHVWIDVDPRGRARIEARTAERALSTREIPLGALDADVAARLVALAVSEMSRGLARPLPARRQAPVARPPPTETDPADPGAITLAFRGGMRGGWLSASSGWLLGPLVATRVRVAVFGAEVAGAWHVGDAGGGAPAGALRWIDLSWTGVYHLPLARDLRGALGAGGAVTAVRLGDATAVDGVAGARSSWTSRVAARLGLAHRAVRPLWLTADVELGALVRPVSFVGPAGEPARLGGAWVALSLGVDVERVVVPPHPPSVRR